MIFFFSIADEIPLGIGTALDECIRHHPTLRDPLLASFSKVGLQHFFKDHFTKTVTDIFLELLALRHGTKYSSASKEI